MCPRDDAPFKVLIRPGSGAKTMGGIEQAVGVLLHGRRPFEVLVGFGLSKQEREKEQHITNRPRLRLNIDKCHVRRLVYKKQ